MVLDFPAPATPAGEMQSPGDTVFFPLAAFSEDGTEGVTAEGAVRKQSWRVGSGALTTLQVLSPLRAQLQSAGYDVLFECEAAACGGFDFRFLLDTFKEPEMHVALGDYRYLAAQRTATGRPDFVSLLISRSRNAGFVQLTLVGASAESGEVTASLSSAAAVTPRQSAGPVGPVGAKLESTGYVVLDDLQFGRGSSDLGDTPYASLQALGDYLNANPDRQIVLVGHTDSEGSLAGNLALSKRRAQAVMARLIRDYGVGRSQVSSDGVGFLSPVASNLTAEGRAQNRRVEAILTSTR